MTQAKNVIKSMKHLQLWLHPQACLYTKPLYKKPILKRKITKTTFKNKKICSETNLSMYKLQKTLPKDLPMYSDFGFGCDKCLLWYYFSCAGIPKGVNPVISGQWFCKFCKDLWMQTVGFSLCLLGLNKLITEYKKKT